MLLRVLYFIMCVTCAFSNRARLYQRIPQYFVADDVYGFIQDNRLNNCFEYHETESHLLLKCWRDNKLVDAELKIIDKKEKESFYYPLLSIVV